MKLSMVFAGAAPIPVQQELAIAAEEAGLYRLWTTESQGCDGLLRAMAIGLSTSRILVGTGIAYTFPRVPLHAAGAAADLAGTLGGRFTFGLGAGTKGIRRRYGIVEDHPAPRFAEYVRAASRGTGQRRRLRVRRAFLHRQGPVAQLQHRPRHAARNQHLRLRGQQDHPRGHRAAL